MQYVIAGLGNPGAEYDNTRHNTGRMLVERFRRAHDFPEWKENKKAHALVSDEMLKKEKVTLVLPEGFMNKSGQSIAPLVKSVKAAERLIVVHDDLDLPLGRIKISFGKDSGGHKGLESIMRALKTKNFIRVRVGITPATPSGKLKKPQGEKAVIASILGTFKKPEQEIFKKVGKRAVEALSSIITDGRAQAMNEYNSL